MLSCLADLCYLQDQIKTPLFEKKNSLSNSHGSFQFMKSISTIQLLSKYSTLLTLMIYSEFIPLIFSWQEIHLTSLLPSLTDESNPNFILDSF